MCTNTDLDKPVGDDENARALITALGLAPHPEGGHYRETWRDTPADGGRGTLTAIYFLLQHGERSHWHRVDATEIWHWHAGAALELSVASDAGIIVTRLGPDVLAGERPQWVVPAGHWQSARARRGWGLVGCTVSPAFEFAGFELAPPGWAPR